ncbi:hypothetical protein [Jannaschia pohangensis]|uniref:Uncharacterized protein n=1 Tax=Jannaschia pohangensis TaxID=390807 RepID=A0A1I3SKB0_9RHOB|nr:hypothetical protein [Jannaschia pohangensis]SFJ59063.1 hypothetical protein SAMN04488095_3185 [Jannaschia pohangensis]
MFKGLFGGRAPVMCDPTEGLDRVGNGVEAVLADDLPAIAPHLTEMTADGRIQWMVALLQSLPLDHPLPEPSVEQDPDRDFVMGCLLAAWLLRTVDVPRTAKVTTVGDDIEALLTVVAERAMGLLIRADATRPGLPDLWGWRLLCASVLKAPEEEMAELADGLDRCAPPSLMAAHLHLMSLRRTMGGSQATMWRYVTDQTAMLPASGWLGLIACAHLEDIYWFLNREPDKAVQKRYRAQITTPAFRAEIVALSQRFLDRSAAEGPSHHAAQRYGRNMIAALLAQIGEGGHLVPHLREIDAVPMHMCWGGMVRLKDLNSVRNLAMMPPLRGG